MQSVFAAELNHLLHLPVIDILERSPSTPVDRHMRTLFVSFVCLIALGAESQPSDMTHPTGLAGVVVAVELDRPVHRPGEVLQARAVLLRAQDHKPLAGSCEVSFLVLDPQGQVLMTARTIATNAVARIRWRIPATSPGGRYSLRAFVRQGRSEGIRDFTVVAEDQRAYATGLVFSQPAYGPGDTVAADLLVRPRMGSLPPDAQVHAVARVDGVEFFRQVIHLDQDGKATISFPLPPTCRGDGAALALVIQDGFTTATTIEPIPLMDGLVTLTFHPESGVLLADHPTRIYVEAHLADGDPAAVQGQILDPDGAVICPLSTGHDGRGRFSFTPGAGIVYRAIINRPAGCLRLFPLPSAVLDGATCQTLADAVPAGRPVEVVVTTTRPGAFRLRLARNAIPVADTPVTLDEPGSRRMAIAVPDWADGVLVVTLLDHAGHALAERLVFRHSQRRLVVSLATDQATYQPGETVRCTMTVTDGAGQPQEAVIGLTVAADIMANGRFPEPAPRLPAMAMLEPEVRRLGGLRLGPFPDPALQDLALDLLLGVQDRRRPTAGSGSRVPTEPSPFLPPVSAPEDHLPRLGPSTVTAAATGLPPSVDEALQAARATADGRPIRAFTPGQDDEPCPVLTGLSRRRFSDLGVMPALRWFQRHQDPDGHWDADGYTTRCRQEGPTCDPMATWADPEADQTITGLVLLCYLGAGYDHKVPNQFRKTLQLALDWLRDRQQQDGSFSDRNEVHAVVTMALAEAYAMTMDPVLREPAQRAIDLLLTRQLIAKEPVAWDEDSRRLGWAVRQQDGRIVDTVTTCWCIMALKSAKAAGLDAGLGLDGTRRWLETLWKRANPGWETVDTYRYDADFPGAWNLDTGNLHQPSLPDYGLLASVFLGYNAEEALAATLANRVMHDLLPRGFPVDAERGYFCTLGIFLTGGDNWQTWNARWRDLILAGQRRVPSCLHGSWDPADAGEIAARGGRVLSTALICLSLEIYYRYLPITTRGGGGDGGGQPVPVDWSLQDRFCTHRGPDDTTGDRQPVATLGWWPTLVTDPATGQVTVTFVLPEEEGCYRLRADAFDARGGLAEEDHRILSARSLRLDVAVPRHLSLGDRLDLPIAVHNPGATIDAGTFTPVLDGTAGQETPLRVASGETCRTHLALQPTRAGPWNLLLQASQGTRRDLLEQTVVVDRVDFPWAATGGGVSTRCSEMSFTIPPSLVAGTGHLHLEAWGDAPEVFRTHVHDLRQDPRKDVEHTSIILHMLNLIDGFDQDQDRGTDGADHSFEVDEALIRHRTHLLTFVRPDGGLSTWGRGEGSPLSTALGLSRYQDARHYDPPWRRLTDRQERWLEHRIDQEGTIAGRPASLSPDLWQAAIAWAMTNPLTPTDPSVLPDNFTPEGWGVMTNPLTQLGAALDRFKDHTLQLARDSDNPYVHALAAKVAFTCSDSDAGRSFLQRLQTGPDGGILGASRALFSRSPDQTAVETTALAMLSWQADRQGDHQAKILAAADFLLSHRRQGHFGTPQATVLTLTAIDSAGLLTPHHGELTIAIDRVQVGRIVIDGAKTPSGADLPLSLPPGDHIVSITWQGEQPLPWTFAVTGHTTQAPSHPAAPLVLTTTLSANRVTVGAPVDLRIGLENRTDATTQAPMAIVGLPAGLEVATDRLAALEDQSRLSHYDLQPGRLVLCWDELGAKERCDLVVPTVARLPGSFTGLAGCAYPAYDGHLRYWVAGATVAVDP